MSISKSSTWVYLSREGKAKGNFPTQLLLLLLKQKCINARKVSCTENGESFLSSAFANADAAPAVLVLQLALNLKLLLVLVFGNALFDTSDNEQDNPESPITCLAE